MHPLLQDDISLDEYRIELADVADILGVPLIPIPPSEHPGIGFAFLPDDQTWFEAHLSLMAFNWRIQAQDAPYSYCAGWCYPGIGPDTFVTALRHLAAWGGDPAGEPTGWIKRHGSLDVRRNWRRLPGRRLDHASEYDPSGM
jgi:hypothetical protein